MKVAVADAGGDNGLNVKAIHYDAILQFLPFLRHCISIVVA